MFHHQRFGLPKSWKLIELEETSLDLLEASLPIPRSVHPAVWERANGDKVLHVSPWQADGVAGRENAEGDALLREVAEEVNRLAESCCYVHDWKPTDMLIWDNWRMLHRVTGCTPPHPRAIQRTTIKGDYGLGRFENGDQGRYKALERAV